MSASFFFSLKLKCFLYDEKWKKEKKTVVDTTQSTKLNVRWRCRQFRLNTLSMVRRARHIIIMRWCIRCLRQFSFAIYYRTINWWLQKMESNWYQQRDLINQNPVFLFSWIFTKQISRLSLNSNRCVARAFKIEFARLENKWINHFLRNSCNFHRSINCPKLGM